MPVELRKRKTPANPVPPPPPKKASMAKKGTKESQEPTPEMSESPPASGKVAVGDVISLEEFGGEVQTQDEKTVTLKKLVTTSKTGVVLFTYPKASTPGCTRQVCAFRDSYEKLSNAGLGVYGLSADSPKANTTFKTKQNLPYRLLCDPKATLIGAIGLKKHPKGTQRGVFVVNKNGKILIAQPGSPTGTLDVVVELIEKGELGETLEEKLEPEATTDKEEEEEEDEKKEKKVEQEAIEDEEKTSGEKTGEE